MVPVSNRVSRRKNMWCFVLVCEASHMSQFWRHDDNFPANSFMDFCQTTLAYLKSFGLSNSFFVVYILFILGVNLSIFGGYNMSFWWYTLVFQFGGLLFIIVQVERSRNSYILKQGYELLTWQVQQGWHCQDLPTDAYLFILQSFFL
jgi:hypothetical protein